MNETIETSLADHARCVEALKAEAGRLETIADVTYHALHTGHRLYVAGNGGSAADAQHIAAELVGRFRQERRGLPAIALTTDTSVLTAIGNDYGFERVFVRQIEAHVRCGDVVWLLSTSGSSLNILTAAGTAKKLGAIVVGFTGEGGGTLGPLCDHCLAVPHGASDRVQEIHALAYHILCDLIEQKVVDEASSSA
ncbi:MAG: SIS domain-containing protein [Phycisphaerae bacterium]|nr:SIS domain-containing protein [Phycisphaerae bacterium]